MARLAVVRPIHMLPGREQEAVQWLESTESERRQAGQIAQYVMRSVVDSAEHVLVQVWESRQAYDAWRKSPARARLADERQRFLTHEPTRLYEVR